MLASEILSSLRHVEKILDELFNDLEQQDLLVRIGQVLYQIQGVLAIQDQADALRVVEHTCNTL